MTLHTPFLAFGCSKYSFVDTGYGNGMECK